MQWWAVAPLLLMLLSVILSFMVTIAGSSRGLLEDYDIATLNTSRLARDILINSPLFNLDSSNPLYNFSILLTPETPVDNGTSQAADLPNVTDLSSNFVEKIMAQTGLSNNPTAHGFVQNLTLSAGNDIDTTLQAFIHDSTEKIIHSFATQLNMLIQNLTVAERANGNKKSASAGMLRKTAQLQPRKPQENPVEQFFGGAMQEFGSNVGNFITGKVSESLADVTTTSLVDTLRTITNELGAILSSNTTNPISSILKDLPVDMADNLRKFVNSGVNGFVESLISALGIEGFYSAHVSKFCYGSYRTVPGPGMQARKNTTGCHKLGVVDVVELHRPDTGNEIQSSSAPAEPLTFTFPQVIRNGFEIMRKFVNALLGLYVSGLVFAMLSVIANAVAIFRAYPYFYSCNAILAAVAAICWSFASVFILLSQVVSQIVLTIFGGWINIESHNGARFAALTWSAAIMADIAAITWIVAWVRNRKHSGTIDIGQDDSIDHRHEKALSRVRGFI